MKKIFILLLAGALTTMGALADNNKKKMSASTQIILNEQAEARAANRAPAKSEPISAFIHITGSEAIADLQALGVIIDNEFEGFVTARIPQDVLSQVIDLPGVTYVKAAEKVQLQSDTARIFTQVYDVLNFTDAAKVAGLKTAYTGKGVVVGVIDVGIDFRHKAFKDVDGKCRISHAYFNRELSLQPDTIINTSNESHGTHTSSLAGGSSVINDNAAATVTVTNEHDKATWGGMAPESELYLCEATNLRNVDVVNYYKAISDYAYKADKPCVISCSFVINVGPHDGTGELIDAIGQISKRNGVVVAKGAGNENTSYAYTYGKVSADQGANILWLNTYEMFCDENSDIDQDQGAYFGVFARTPETQFTVQTHIVDTTSGQVMYSSPVYHFDSKYSLNEQDKTEYLKYFNGYINVQMAYDINNGKYYSYLRPVSPNGFSEDDTTKFYKDNNKYAVVATIKPENEEDEFYIDAWANQSMFDDNTTTAVEKLGGFTTTPASNDCCVCTDSYTDNAIIVGAYMSRKECWNSEKKLGSYGGDIGDIAYFSSYADPNYGPLSGTDDVLSLPDVAAPGYTVYSAVNKSVQPYYVANTDEQNPYAYMSGTSMACPIAAGIIALWLQAAYDNNLELNTDSIRHIINLTGDHDNFTNNADGSFKVVFGPGGKINALKGLAYILKVAAEKSSVTESEVANKVVANIRYVNLAGVESDKPFDGVNLVVTRYTDGTERVVKRTY